MVFLDKGIARLFGEFFALSCLGAILFCTSALVVTAHRPVRPVDDERERQNPFSQLKRTSGLRRVTAGPSSEIASTSFSVTGPPGSYAGPPFAPAAAVQAIPVAAAAFFATRLSFEPVFRSALFADFLAFDKDPDFFRFFMCSSLCRDCAARRLNAARGIAERVPPEERGSGRSSRGGLPT